MVIANRWIMRQVENLSKSIEIRDSKSRIEPSEKRPSLGSVLWFSTLCSDVY